MKKILYVILVALISASCEKIIEFKGEATAPMLVVNSLISPDSTIQAVVSQSRFFLEQSSETKYVDNADFRLFVNGEDKGKLVRFPSVGAYGTDYKVLPGDKVKIEVSANGFASVLSTTIVPPEPVILQVDTSSTSEKRYQLKWDEHSGGPYGPATFDTVGEYREKRIRFSVKFKDNGDEKNFYRMVVVKRTYFDPNYQPGGLINENGFIDEYVRDFEDVVFGNRTVRSGFEGIFGNDGNTYYYDTFSDELLNGKEYSITFSNSVTYDYISYGDQGNNPYPVFDRTEYFIYLQEISADYYLYVRSMVSAINVGDNPFVEPVQVRSNIENGIGILGSFTSSKAAHVVIQN